jgi:hypothetical protein
VKAGLFRRLWPEGHTENMMFDQQVPRLDGLFALSRTPGLDVRPTLLRVLTDLFVNARQRGEDDLERYAELAGHLIDQVDDETRLVVAGKLGPCAFAPRSVLDKLIAAEPNVAARVIEVSPLMTRDDLWTLATDGGPLTSAAIARRSDLDGELIRFLARKGISAVAEALGRNPAAAMDRETIALLSPLAATTPSLAELLAARGGVKAEWLAPIFLELDEAVRATVLTAFGHVDQAKRPVPREALILAPKLVLDALESAALSRDLDGLAGGIAQLFGMTPDTALRIVRDRTGEALTVTLIAIGVPVDQATRILMFANTEAGSSFQHMRKLVGLVETLPRNAATRLARLFSETLTEATPVRHEPVFVETQPVRARKQSRRRAEGSETSKPADKKA